MPKTQMDMLQDTINNPNARVQIIGRQNTPDKTGVNVIGWLTRAMSFEGIGASWSAPFEFTSAQAMVSTVYNVIANLAGLEQLRIANPAQSALFWKDSTRPRVSVSLVFVSYARGRDPRQEVLQLLKCVAPTLTQSLVGTVYAAPLGYSISYDSRGLEETSGSATKYSVNGTVTLNVGQWFRATNLVVERVSPSPSIMTTVEGFPLYITAEVVLQPYMMMTYDDFCNWFMISSKIVSTEKTGSGSRKVEDQFGTNEFSDVQNEFKLLGGF